MAIQIDLLHTMTVFEKYYTAEERWEKLKQLLQDQQAAQQSVQPTLLMPCEYCGGSHDKSLGCHESLLVTQSG